MTAATVYRVRNLRSGLFVPSSGSVKATPLTFNTYQDAELWFDHLDAPMADFKIEECEDDGQR